MRSLVTCILTLSARAMQRSGPTLHRFACTNIFSDWVVCLLFANTLGWYGIPVKLGNASVEADGAKFARYYEHLNAEHGNVHVHTRDIMTLDVDDVDDADGADAFSLLHMVTDGYNDIGYKTHVHISHDATSLTTSPIPIDPSTLKPMTVITITTCAAVFIELFADQ